MNITANASRIILIGAHMDDDSPAQMMRTLRNSNVTVIGLELPRTLNAGLEQIQQGIRAGTISEGDIGARLADMLDREGKNADYGRLENMASTIYSATRLGMRVTAIDARTDGLDREGLMAQAAGASPERMLELRRQVTQYAFGADADTAGNALLELGREQPTSRMAIFYGGMHINPGAGVNAMFGDDRPQVLGEILGRERPVTSILTETQDTLAQQSHAGPERVLNPQHQISRDFLRNPTSGR